MKWRNPLAFRPIQVTFWTTVVYLALIIPIVFVQETVPPPPKTPTPFPGVNLDDAWADLSAITRAYHPFNSKFNEDVREHLLGRVQDILNENGVPWMDAMSPSGVESSSAATSSGQSPLVAIFDDLESNVTLTVTRSSASKDASCGMGTYFEGTNVIVYIRGTDDDEGEWWRKPAEEWSPNHHGVLMNAHYDSVSTGYGATDDGMGVVTVLQMISHFTTPGHQPKHGIVALLNNGEEDYLWGARAFAKSPLMPFVHTFLNLEGAGAGGRAVLFRSTDTEVTKAYAKSSNPFGTVIGSDSFSMGFIKSQTDYIIFDGIYGARGLDLAFYEPRSMYHTKNDDARHTSRASLWHMLSASVKAMQYLSSASGDGFAGPRRDDDGWKVPSGKRTDGVWFDVWGKAFALMELRTLFGWSLGLLIGSPLFLMLVTYVIARHDKYYFFSRKVTLRDSEGIAESVTINGWRGVFRFFFAIVVASGLVAGSGLLLRKINPLIIYSSSYAVWAMMLSLFYFAFWVVMRGADSVRPSALHRGYAFLWLYVITWLILIGVTVLQDRFRIASGYPFVFLHAATFLCLLISLCELFALPTKKDFSGAVNAEAEARREYASDGGSLASARPGSGDAPRPSTTAQDSGEPEDENADERTPLIARSNSQGPAARTTFATGYRRSLASIASEPLPQIGGRAPFEREQAWSADLPSWTWILQLLLIGPVPIWLFGQLGLFLTAAVSGTGADGSSLLFPYTLIATFGILTLLPLTPFIHRVPYQLPLLVLGVFAGTLIYTLTAFPFSSNNQYKVFFQQTLDLETGASKVTFDGMEEFVRPIIAELPSAAGKHVECIASGRVGLRSCRYDGSAVLPNLDSPRSALSKGDIAADTRFSGLVSINSTQPDPAVRRATLEINAVGTKACFLYFDKRVTKFEIEGSTGLDPRFGDTEQEVCQLRLWRRDWEKVWRVDVEWEDVGASNGGSSLEPTNSHGEGDLGDGELHVRDGGPGLGGEVACMWADANEKGTIPALDEALQYIPVWATISKLAEGLVVGKKRFRV